MESFSGKSHPYLRDILGVKSRSMSSVSQKPVVKFKNNGNVD